MAFFLSKCLLIYIFVWRIVEETLLEIIRVISNSIKYIQILKTINIEFSLIDHDSFEAVFGIRLFEPFPFLPRALVLGRSGGRLHRHRHRRRRRSMRQV